MTHPFDDNSIKHNTQTVAFYNCENLFDFRTNVHANHQDFSPTVLKNWTAKRYQDKIEKLGFSISKIGRKETGKHPAIVGLCEVGSDSVLKDLITSKHLKHLNYKYIHNNSLDQRGIDVALLYNANVFDVATSKTFTIKLPHTDGLTNYTRDILLVSGVLDGESIHVIVNHWPSRREGEKETEPKRIASSNKLGEIINILRLANDNSKIILVGDFNDEPHNHSVKQLVNTFDFYNPMETLRAFSRGSTYYRRQWYLFDQILISNHFLKTSDEFFEYDTANIFDEDFLKVLDGKFKGTPFRTYIGKKYQGGYSDHFPVYIVFKR